LRVESSRSRVKGLGFRVQGLGFRVQGFRFRVEGFAHRAKDHQHLIVALEHALRVALVFEFEKACVFRVHRAQDRHLG